jgi:hypothetical protein
VDRLAGEFPEDLARQFLGLGAISYDAEEYAEYSLIVLKKNGFEFGVGIAGRD